MLRSPMSEDSEVRTRPRRVIPGRGTTTARRRPSRPTHRLSAATRRRLGAQIARLRRRARLSQSELGGGVIWRSAVSRIEAGEHAPSIDTLRLFATVLRCPLRALVSEI